MLGSKEAQLFLGTLVLQGKNKTLLELELLKKNMAVTPGLHLREGEAGVAREILNRVTSAEIACAYTTDFKPLHLYSERSQHW